MHEEKRRNRSTPSAALEAAMLAMCERVTPAPTVRANNHEAKIMQIEPVLSLNFVGSPDVDKTGECAG